ncbi:MAG TPA: class I SAM-dependent methyltransferase [Spirochaetota bacterium]|nr:class I SAM-dependent methyltransferase [Spirochaetota bacterium]HOS32077.1 class I SAM-dependent methyltransferase [Spirochaetota bacterium]HOS55418.1 class I SAM-dependent methyltransferase [Spirochaetota bacterium]HPK62951.1 class I SAM-dependent methyltransferase [Spirochaetota bacterium]HQF76866.1 class I SAM-dependent methyltransferase [Spirochaetota bacterium]
MSNNLSDVADYIDKLNSNNPLYIFYNEIIDFQKDHIIPAVRFDTAIFLMNMVLLIKPKKILEIGFGSGVSALFMSAGIRTNEFCKIVSLERDKNRYLRGNKILEKYDNRNIELINADAFKYLSNENNKRQCDLIFLDAVKRDYIDYLPILKNYICKNGVLITDNILFNGKVTENKTPEKYKNGVELLKQYNEALSKDADFNTSFFYIGDGISLSIKK